MEVLSQYAVVLVTSICLAVGYIIKHFMPLDNKWIPLIMGALGLVLNMWLSAWAFTPEILLGGLASGLAATGVYEAKGIFQSKKAE